LTNPSQPEPWLRGTHGELPAVIRAALHALELAHEDIQRWCGELSDDELNARPAGLPSVAFHVNHICGSLDRLLTYAEGRELDENQLSMVDREVEFRSYGPILFRQLAQTLARSEDRLRAFTEGDLQQPRFVGRRRLPTSLGGLLVHIADHTQRHVGQAITTARIVRQHRQL